MAAFIGFTAQATFYPNSAQNKMLKVAKAPPFTDHWTGESYGMLISNLKRKPPDSSGGFYLT